mgnify:CR=1 FL=1
MKRGRPNYRGTEGRPGCQGSSRGKRTGKVKLLGDRYSGRANPPLRPSYSLIFGNFGITITTDRTGHHFLGNFIFIAANLFFQLRHHFRIFEQEAF